MTDAREYFTALCRRLSGATVEITDETRLADDLGLDSLDLLDLAMRCEEHFHIMLADDEIDAPECGTVGGMLGLIELKLSARAAA